MATNATTPPVTVLCSGALLIGTTITMALTSVGQTVLAQHDVVLPLQLILRGKVRGSVGLTNMPHQPQSQMPSQTYANYAMGPP